MKTRLISLLEKFQDQNMVMTYESKACISPIPMFGFTYYPMDNFVRIGQLSFFYKNIHNINTDDETYILLTFNDESKLMISQEEDVYED